jgi:transposase
VVQPRNLPGRTGRELAVELVAEVQALDGKFTALTPGACLRPSPPSDPDRERVRNGPVGAARILADVGDVARFSDRNRFAWTRHRTARRVLRMRCPGLDGQRHFSRSRTGDVTQPDQRA